MQTWHCIALIILSVGIFFYASYLDDVHKSTTLSLDDLAEFEKSLDQTKKNEEKNSSQSLNLGKQTTWVCLLYTSPSPRDLSTSRMPSSA